MPEASVKFTFPISLKQVSLVPLVTNSKSIMGVFGFLPFSSLARK
jgi:hypothetical protein